MEAIKVYFETKTKQAEFLDNTDGVLASELRHSC